MNSDTLKGQWKQLKGAVKERWGQLTDDELDVMDGQKDQLVGKVQERYGYTRDVAEREVDDFIQRARPAVKPSALTPGEAPGPARPRPAPRPRLRSAATS